MITIHDWIGEQRNLLIEFEQWWQENHTHSSVQFPASLDEGDWVEQFAFSVGSEKELHKSVREENAQTGPNYLRRVRPDSRVVLGTRWETVA